MLNSSKIDQILVYPQDSSMLRINDKKGRDLKEIRVNLDRNKPVGIYTYESCISLDNETYIYFDSLESERFFIQELHFILETVNNVDMKRRSTTDEICVSYQEVLEGKK
jgi:hypothetical protein